MGQILDHKTLFVIWLLIVNVFVPLSSLICPEGGTPHDVTSQDEYNTSQSHFKVEKPQGSISRQSSGDLILYFPFDEGEGEIAYDKSGLGNDGRIYDGSWTQGISGHGLEFNGDDGYVNCGTDLSTDILDAITLEAWLCIYGGNSFTYSQVIVGKWLHNGVNKDSYLLELTADGRFLRLYFTNIEILAPTKIPRNEWVHVAGTYDGYTLCMYINGALVASHDRSDAIVGSVAPLVVGGHNGTAEEGDRNSLNGTIDEVRVYNRSLSAYEIWEDYRMFNSSEGLISWWRGENDARDEIGNNHGTFVGAVEYENGISGQAFQLNGVDSFISIPHNPIFDFGSTDFTISLWVNFSSIEGEMVLIEKYVEKFSSASTGWTLTKLVHNDLRFAVPPYDYDMTPPSISLNNWINIVVTRLDGSLTFYWNSIVLLSASGSDMKSSSSSLKFGHRGNPSDTPGSEDSRGYYLHGLVDEVQIYNRSLSAEEIEARCRDLRGSHPLVKVSNDAELAAVAASGAGTTVDPYVIDGWIISTVNSRAIDIRDTTSHFVIRNCRIETGNTKTAIYIQNARHGTVTLDSNFCKRSSGIVIADTSGARIINNICTLNDQGEGFPCGVHLIRSGFSIITNNVFNNNDDCGIWLSDSPNCFIKNNTCNHNRRGLEVGQSENTTIIFNIFNENEIGGIWLYGSSSNSTVLQNICRDNTFGIHVENTNGCIFNGNVLEENSDGIRFSSCNTVNITKNHIIDNIWSGIRVTHSNYISICNNSIVLNGASGNTGEESGSSGIQIVDSRGGRIFGNLINSNNITAIDIFFSTELIITQNNFINNMRGLPSDNVSQVYEYTNSPEEHNNFTHNYWTEWNIPDVNSDGIVDVPYVIGGGSNKDSFPLTDPLLLILLQEHLFISPGIINPRGIVFFDKVILIDWIEAIDFHNHPITYSLFYSINNGNTWNVIVSNITSRSYLWNVSNIRDGSICLVKVVAIFSEGFTLSDTSISHLRIDHLPPQIVLDQISNNSVICTTTSANFTIYDSSLSIVSAFWDFSYFDSQYRWNPAVQIFNMTFISCQVPSSFLEGYHWLTITAIDALGRQTAQDYRFYVNTPPLIVLKSPLNNSILMNPSEICFDVSDLSLREVWYEWDSQGVFSLSSPYVLIILPSSGFHQLTIRAQDNWNEITIANYKFYILGPPSIDLPQFPPESAFSGKSFVYSLTITNSELVPLYLSLMILGTDDYVTEGNGTQIFILPRDQITLDLEIQPKHASLHRLIIILFYGENLYYSYLLSFNVVPPLTFSSSSFLFLFSILGLISILFFVITMMIVIRKYKQSERQFQAYHTQLVQLIDLLTISNLEQLTSEMELCESEDLLGFSHRLFQDEPLDREALEQQFLHLQNQIDQEHPELRRKLSRILNDVIRLL